MKTHFTILLVVHFCLCTPLAAQEFSATKTKRLTNVTDSYPMISPDGKKIVFQSNRTGDAEIFSMNIDGTDIKQLTHSPGFDGGPVWSPDGSKIVFPSERDNDSEIYVMNADGSNQTRLTHSPGNDSHPHWFPDGKRIIFNSARTSPDLKSDWGKQWHEIFSMASDGTDVKQITAFKTVSTYSSVSPDGKKVAFRRVTDGSAYNWDLSFNERNRNSEVFVMDIDGKNPVNLSNSPAFDGWPWWSPDGKQILFSSNRYGPANVGQLFIINIDGTNLRKLTELPFSVTQAKWANDGKRIFAFQAWETPDYEYGNLIMITN